MEREGGREGGREVEREGGGEGGRWRGMEGGGEGGREEGGDEGSREERSISNVCKCNHLRHSISNWIIGTDDVQERRQQWQHMSDW